MTKITNLREVNQFSELRVAYIYVADFKSYLKLYEQILKCEMIVDGNRNAWEKDYSFGEKYLLDEFNFNFRDGYLHIRVYKSLSDNLKLSFIDKLDDIPPKYEFVANSYQIDLI